MLTHWPRCTDGLEIDNLTSRMSGPASSLPASGPPRPRSRFVTAAVLPALAVALLWSVFLLDEAFYLGLRQWAVLPRHASGLPGIVMAPLLHADTDHLWNNSISLLMLGWALMYFYPRVAGKVVLWSWLGTGLMVWLTARANLHLGASGVVYGMAAFLFVSGMLRGQRTLMAVSLLVVFLYGSMVWGVFPIVPRLSWESHAWGAIAGIILAYRHRHVPPAVQDPVVVLDDEDDEPPSGQGGEADEVNEAELAWKRRLAEQAQRAGGYDPSRTSSTGWHGGSFPE